MSDQPSKRKVLFDDASEEDGELAAAERGEISLGKALSRSRGALGISIAEVAGRLCIRETFLDALEAGDHARLPGPAYAIGFVRSYADFLSLDGEEAVRIFKAERKGETPSSSLVFPEPVAESRIPRGAVLFISVVLAVAAYGGWYYLSSHDMDLADLVPEVPANLSDGTTSVPAPASAPMPYPASPLAATEAKPEPAQDKPDELKLVTPEPAPAPVVAAPKSAPQPAPAAAPTQTASAPATIEIRAKADSWVQVRRDDGRVVMMRILRKGDSYQVPNENGLTMMTGNAGGIEIVVDGQLVPPIGPFGAVKRDVSLDAARLKAGTAVP